MYHLSRIFQIVIECLSLNDFLTYQSFNELERILILSVYEARNITCHRCGSATKRLEKF